MDAPKRKREPGHKSQMWIAPKTWRRKTKGM